MAACRERLHGLCGAGRGLYGLFCVTFSLFVSEPRNDGEAASHPFRRSARCPRLGRRCGPSARSRCPPGPPATLAGVFVYTSGSRAGRGVSPASLADWEVTSRGGAAGARPPCGAGADPLPRPALSPRPRARRRRTGPWWAAGAARRTGSLRGSGQAATSAPLLRSARSAPRTASSPSCRAPGVRSWPRIIKK